jgi:hypothetical protein
MTHGIDPVLAHLVDDLAALDRFGVNTVLTMAVDHALVTGTPVAEEEYFERLGDRFREAVANGIGEVRFHRGDGLRLNGTTRCSSGASPAPSSFNLIAPRGVAHAYHTKPIMERFAEARSFLRKHGQLISDFDLLVGATALHHDLTVLTFNLRDFQRIPDLKLYQPS